MYIWQILYVSSPPTAAATQTTQIRSVQLKSDTNVLVKCLKSCTFWNVVLFKCLKCCTFWNPTQFWGTSTIFSCTIYTITICSHPNPSISQNFCTTCTRCRYLPFISNTTKLMPSFSLVSSQLRKLPDTVIAWLARARTNDNTAPIRVA